MDPEVQILLIGVLSDAIKILGPAIITAIVGYKVGQYQSLLKIEEINKANEFSAREKIFEFHKEKLIVCDKSVAELNSALYEFAGMSLADENDELKISSFVSRHLALHIEKLPFQINHIVDELEKYASKLPREKEKLEEYSKAVVSLQSPVSQEEIQQAIVDLISIYSFLSHCIRNIVELEALDIFKPYTENA